MEYFKCVETRRSVRKYKDEKLDPALLEKIMKAGQSAPSAINSQNYILTCISNDNVIEQILNALRVVLDSPKYNGFFDAPHLTLISLPKDYKNKYFDAACVAQNIMMASRALDIGSCWINQLKDHSDAPEIRKILNELQIPEDYEVLCAIVLGFPDGDFFKERENKSILQYF